MKTYRLESLLVADFEKYCLDPSFWGKRLSPTRKIMFSNIYSCGYSGIKGKPDIEIALPWIPGVIFHTEAKNKTTSKAAIKALNPHQKSAFVLMLMSKCAVGIIYNGGFTEGFWPDRMKALPEDEDLFKFLEWDTYDDNKDAPFSAFRKYVEATEIFFGGISS